MGIKKTASAVKKSVKHYIIENFYVGNYLPYNIQTAKLDKREFAGLFGFIKNNPLKNIFETIITTRTNPMIIVIHGILFLQCARQPRKLLPTKSTVVMAPLNRWGYPLSEMESFAE